MRRKKNINLRSLIMILLILAFIIGVCIGVAQIFDWGEDADSSSKIVYEDVTYNISYYENQSTSQDFIDSGNYTDDNLKVYNASEFIKKNKTNNKTKIKTNATK